MHGSWQTDWRTKCLPVVSSPRGSGFVKELLYTFVTLHVPKAECMAIIKARFIMLALVPFHRKSRNDPSGFKVASTSHARVHDYTIAISLALTKS